MAVVDLAACKISAVRANMVESEVVISIKTSLDAELMDSLRWLRDWANDKTLVNVTCKEQQMKLPFKRYEGRTTVTGGGRSVTIDPDAAQAMLDADAEREQLYEQAERVGDELEALEEAQGEPPFEEELAEDEGPVNPTADIVAEEEAAEKAARTALEAARSIQRDTRDLGLDRPRDVLEAGED